MFQFIKGANPSADVILKEEYGIDGNWIYANISAEKIRKVIEKFIEVEAGNGFCLFIEIPANIEGENIVSINDEGYYEIENRHMDVFYLDNISGDYVLRLLDRFSDILVNDGLSHFGVLSQSGREIGKYKYNVIKAYTRDDMLPLLKVFNSFELPETDELVTAWDYFDQDSPGEISVYEKDGKTIYDLVDLLKTVGMYKYEQRIDS